MRILVVEDEPAQQEAARLQLKDHEVEVVDYLQLYKIADAADGGAKEKLVDFVRSFDVLLTDLFMPAPKRSSSGPPVKAPVGWCVLLMGLDCGIKKIGLFTDMHRHVNVVSYALDMMVTGMMQTRAHLITVGDAKIAILNCDVTLVHGIRYSHRLSHSYSAEEKEALAELAEIAAEERCQRVENREEEPVIDYNPDHYKYGVLSDVGLKDWRYVFEVLLE